MADRLDIIILGATGFTGKFTLPQVYKFAKSEGRALTWGIAGRSEQKLKDVLAETAKRIGVDDLNSIPIIIADINDEESIKQMTARARAVINCCGPYVLYGEVLVKSCIETGTHHVDVSGEPLFIEGMELKYNKAAQEKGVYIVSACGFDSVPADLGLVFLEKNFEGTLNSVELYLRLHQAKDSSVGPAVHYGTWASLVNGMGSFSQAFAQRKQLYSNPLPSFKPKLSLRFPLRKIQSNKWAVPFLGADRDIINRSQRYFYDQEKKRPIQAHCYVLLPLVAALLGMVFGLFVFILAQFEFGRNLLLKHPKFFTAGYFSHEDPLEEVLERQHFSVTLEGEGWSEKLADADDQYKTPPNKTIVGRVSGFNPGYGFTCAALALSAIMILTEPKQLPVKGGVYTTAAAFSKTSLVEELQKSGVVFEILSAKDL